MLLPKSFVPRLALACLLTSSIFAVAQAQESPRKFTADDYARAEKMMGYNTAPLVLHAGVRANWLPDDRFWYRTNTENGTEFILVDPAKGTRRPAFDHAKLAAGLSAAAGAKYDARKLPFTDIDFTANNTIVVEIGSKRFKCDLAGYTCTAENGRAANAKNEVLSPDGKRAAFIRDWNLWVRDVATGKETQLTTDGVKDYGYATDNAGWTHSDRAILLWSPDSKKIATFQQDQRKVGEMYLVDTRVGHPKLQAWKYPLPGDENVSMLERVIIEVDSPKVIRLKMPPDQHRSSLCDHITCRQGFRGAGADLSGGDWTDVQWSPDGTKLAFVSTSRDHKQENLRLADAVTGEVRDVLEERVPTYFESGMGRVNWRYLPDSNEIIWYSERDNWGQLYLYDLATGKLKNQITTGEGNVAQLLRVDEKTRMLYFIGVGKEKGRQPYFMHLYRIAFDGQKQALLSPEDAHHEIGISPSGRYFVDSYSKPDVAPVAVVRDTDGKVIASLEKADISKLTAAGWKPPIQFTVKARDGVTDLYGLMYTPTNLDEKKKYPIVNHIYPGPQSGSVAGWGFSASRGDAQALAELGFIVVELDGMGTPGRSKKFHDAYFGNMGDNTLPDQVAAMKQLAARFPFIDIDRAGIYGHSGGGYAAADAMFRYPDFFKVGISEAGNHDNRVYEDDWAEKWTGLLVKNSDGTSNYDSQANQSVAKNLKGHLLLAHGLMDDNVPPNNTLLVVNELIKANKDFDLLLLPNRNHGFGSEPYMVRRRWDYFVRYLLGAEPPSEYELHPPANQMRGF